MAIRDTWESVSNGAKQTIKDWSSRSTLNQNIRGDAVSYGASDGRYGTGQYNVKSHSYPNDLMASDGRYGGNYVIFYINIATDSKLKPPESELVAVNEVPVRDRGDLIAQNLSGGAGGQLTTAQGTLAAGGAFLGKFLGAGGTGVAAGALATVGAGVTASVAASASRQQRRLKTAIALHVPNQLSIRYGMQWSEDDTFALAAAAASGTEIAKAIQSKDAKNLSEPAKAIVANLALSKGPNAGAISAATGLAANPRKEQVFKGVDFRTFQFDYQFFPRSMEEAENVMRIINEFKFHMHPEFKDNNNFLYIYPSEFDISYFQGGQENLNLHRHTSCVLTEMNINYTPNGTFTTFPNGMPTQINVTMNFRELALLTKQKVRDGL
jgi:hypothetical protein